MKQLTTWPDASLHLPQLKSSLPNIFGNHVLRFKPQYVVTKYEGINWKTASWKAQSTQPRQLLFTLNSIKDYLRVAFEAYFTRNGFQNHWNTFLLYLRWKELCIFTVSLNVYCWALDQAFEGVSVCHDIPTHTTWDKCTLPFAELSALDSNCKIRYLGSILLRG